MEGSSTGSGAPAGQAAFRGAARAAAGAMSAVRAGAVMPNTAPNATAGLATNIVLGRMLLSTESVDDNSVLNNIGGVELALPPQCDAICAAISVANSQNRATISWRYSG